LGDNKDFDEIRQNHWQAKRQQIDLAPRFSGDVKK
jgi:hypothetical protein